MKPTLLDHLRKNKTKILIIVVVVLVLVGGILLMRHWEKTQRDPSDGFLTDESGNRSGENDNRVVVTYEGEWYQLRDDVDTVLLIGLDKFEDQIRTDSYNNDQQADFLMLLVLDRGKQTASVIHLNRDTMTNVDVLSITGQITGTQYMQLALSHTFGSGHGDSARNTVRAASALLYDTPIDHYVTVTMDAVSILNDRVGGVTLTVQDDMTSVDPSFVQGAEVTLIGEQALRYVRARKDLAEPTNLARMTRQRQFLEALYNAVMAKSDGDDSFLVETILAIGDYMESDLSDTRLEDLTKQLRSYTMNPIISIEGEARKGEKFMEFYPDEEALQKCLITLFYEKTEVE